MAADQAPPRIVAKAPPPPPSGGQFWIEGSYLYWTQKGDHLPALVTQGGTGALGAPGTTVLFGNSDVNDGWRSGGRLRLGYWFDPVKKSGIEAHFFMLGQDSTGFNASSAGAPLLARPFFNVGLNAQDALLLASPGLLSGRISIEDTSRLFGAGAAYKSELCASCALGNVHGFIGYRYLNLRDKLQISTSSLGIGGVIAGFTFTGAEEFATTNEFHGLDLGLNGELKSGLWSFEWTTKVALGATLTDLSISGVNTVNGGGGPVATPGSLLAQPTNIGNFSRNTFSAVPEVSAKLGYQINPSIRVFVGYDVMYWTGVTRPGGAIDTGINTSQLGGGALVGAPRPTPLFNTTDYWAHGASVGVNARF